MDLLKQVELAGWDGALLVGLIEDAAGDVSAVLEGDEDDRLGGFAGAETTGRVEARGGVEDVDHAAVVEGRPGRLRQRPPANVLQDALVDGDGVVPALALEHLEDD